MSLMDNARRTESGFVDLADGWWQLIAEVCGDDLELLEECKARRHDAQSLVAWVEKHRPYPKIDGKTFTPLRPRVAEVEAPEEFPGWGPPSDHLHDGSEIFPYDEVGYRCLVCRDAGFVRKDVPVGHADFGQAFPCKCQVENDAARMERAMTRLRRSGLPEELHRCTLDAFKPRDGTLNGRRAVESWLEALRTAAERPRWLALFGTTGAGKTHLLAAATQAAVPLIEVCFAEQPQFLADCKAGNFALDDELTARATTATVLVLDRVGATRVNDTWGAEKIERILVHRYERRMFTALGLEVSNRELREWSPRLASRVSDRDLSLSVILSGGDYRGQRGA